MFGKDPKFETGVAGVGFVISEITVTEAAREVSLTDSVLKGVSSATVPVTVPLLGGTSASGKICF